MDEEIIGDEGAAGKLHLQKAGDANAHSRLAVSSARTRGQSAPMPASGPGAQEDDKDTAKQRLQRLIRDFAHDAVGPGLEVEAQSKALMDIDSATAAGVQQALLRMDRRLSRLELWPLNSVDGPPPGSQPLYFITLHQVTAINKGVMVTASQAEEQGDGDGGTAVDGEAAGISDLRINSSLTVVQRAGPEMRLLFDSGVSRDRAYTCLRIFQMSVDQSIEGASRENESDMTGYESSSLAASP